MGGGGCVSSCSSDDDIAIDYAKVIWILERKRKVNSRYRPVSLEFVAHFAGRRRSVAVGRHASPIF